MSATLALVVEHLLTTLNIKAEPVPPPILVTVRDLKQNKGQLWLLGQDDILGRTGLGSTNISVD